MQPLRKHLLTKPDNSLQQLFQFSLTTNVYNKSGNQLFTPQKLPRFKLQEVGRLEILAWQLST